MQREKFQFGGGGCDDIMISVEGFTRGSETDITVDNIDEGKERSFFKLRESSQASLQLMITNIPILKKMALRVTSRIYAESIALKR